MMHSEYIVGGWPRQILGTMGAVATVSEAAEFYGWVNNARFPQFAVSKILRHLNTATSTGEAVKLVR